MNFSNFSTYGLDAFAHQFQELNPVVVFHHIPKTAGSSLSRELRMTLSPYKNICVDYEKLQGPGPLTFRQLMRESVELFVEDIGTKRFRSASGHFFSADMDIIKARIPHAAVFTFLRDPVARTISAYRYSCTPTHPLYEKFIEQYPSIEAYIDAPENQNYMCDFMGSKYSKDASLETTLNRYFFLGLVEDLTLHFEFITGLLGYPKKMASRANVTAPSETNKIELTPELTRRIEQANAQDVEVYTAVQKIVTNRRADMVDFVAERRAFYTSDEG